MGEGRERMKGKEVGGKGGTEKDRKWGGGERDGGTGLGENSRESSKKN